jgi:hypothetical protein
MLFRGDSINIKKRRMKKKQDVHIGMINSFNVITGRATVEQIVSAGLGVFAHNPNGNSEKKNIEFILFYFRELEMYERCKEINDYINETYNEDGSFKVQFCDCDHPDIKEYTAKPKCCICNLEIKR